MDHFKLCWEIGAIEMSNLYFVVFVWFQTTITELGRKHVYLLLLIFFFSLTIHGLIFRVLWLDSIVGGSSLSKYTAWRSQLG